MSEEKNKKEVMDPPVMFNEAAYFRHYVLPHTMRMIELSQKKDLDSPDIIKFQVQVQGKDESDDDHSVIVRWIKKKPAEKAEMKNLVLEETVAEMKNLVLEGKDEDRTDVNVN